ncbi:MAG: phosphatidylinositol-specific phospholipase C/glycerophosphodiester phosphodiesterase family protein [Ferruginibacter sp.]
MIRSGFLWCLAMLFYISPIFGQELSYSTANAHSHNDYEQPKPFFQAYDRQFGSIEADIHLFGKLLLVSHDSAHLVKKKSLENLYLIPLSKCIEKNNGYIYKDSSRKLQLLIDLKTDGFATMKALVKLLKKYPAVIHNSGIRIVITGNRPADNLYQAYPDYIWFDGVLSRNYSDAALSRIALLSDDLRRYSKWPGNDTLLKSDRILLTALVGKAHRLQKPVRFWACPDSAVAWKEMMSLQVDYINTDHIEALADFLVRRNDLPAEIPKTK